MTTTPAPVEALTEDHKEIWLEPKCAEECGEGRGWCQDDAWGCCDECGLPSVRYVRADLVPALTASPATDDIGRLVERLESHMGKQDVPILLADCRSAATALLYQQSEINRLVHDIERSVATSAELAMENKALREVVEPFAVAADEVPGDVPDATHIEKALPGGVPATVGDFRRARAALPKAST